MTVTQAQEPKQNTPPKGGSVTLGKSRARRDQLISLAVMVVCLALILALQPTLRAKRSEIVVDPLTSPENGGDGNGTALRELSVEFPRLTLGGFRGILAAELWRRAEDAKNERQWTELGSMYNIIGKIEPYFVTVYVFNAWNQAYNLSAQWHSIDNKYKWVLEGLEHLYDGEHYNPGSPDILLEEAQMYFMKLGTSFERISYRQFWRDNIAHQYELQDQTAKPGEQGYDAFDAHRKVRGFILRPQFQAELREDPKNPARVGYGIRVRGLNAEKPDEATEFQYGVSPFYFAYMEYKRCLTSGRPSTTGPRVVDAYPAMSLRMWCRDDAYYAQTRVKEMFAEGAKDGSIQDFDAKVFELRDCFRNIEMVAPMAVEEFGRHLRRYPKNEGTHRKHILETEFLRAIGAAEGEMFEGLVQWQLGGRKMTPAARSRLEAALPKYVAGIGAIKTYLDRIFPVGPNGETNPDRLDFEKYMKALQGRIDGVQKLLNAPPTEAPDFEFLKGETVER